MKSASNSSSAAAPRRRHRLRVLLLAGCLIGQSAVADTFEHPILPRYAPDPSIVRVGDDDYLTNSTFAYFPGLPIGHALHHDVQSGLYTADLSSGEHAPTIHCHDGTC